MNKELKRILAILFFTCLADLSYGFYQRVRFTALVGFAILAYQAKERESKTEMIIFICLAILFQPLIKILLGRTIWNIVDLIVGFSLLASIFTKQKIANEK